MYIYKYIYKKFENLSCRSIIESGDPIISSKHFFADFPQRPILPASHQQRN